MGRDYKEWKEEQADKDWAKNGWWHCLIIGIVIGVLLRGCAY